MRYVVTEYGAAWTVNDTQKDQLAVLFIRKAYFPDAENLARTKCEVLNKAETVAA